MLAQALTEYERMLCPGCGNNLSESMDPNFQNDWVSPYPHRCHACTAIDSRAAQYSDSDAPGALRFSAHRLVRPGHVGHERPPGQ